MPYSSDRSVLSAARCQGLQWQDERHLKSAHGLRTIRKNTQSKLTQEKKRAILIQDFAKKETSKAKRPRKVPASTLATAALEGPD